MSNLERAWLVFFMGLALILTGCTKQQQVKIAETTIETSVGTNNAMVSALQKIHDRARADRKAAMKTIAKTAATKTEGRQQIDDIDKQYARAFEIFQNSEKVQHVLAEALETARAALEAGESPDINKLLTLYTEVQGLYNSIVVILSEVK